MRDIIYFNLIHMSGNLQDKYFSLRYDIFRCKFRYPCDKDEKAVFFLQYKCSEVLTSTAKEIVSRYHAINLNLSLRVPLQLFQLVVKHSYRLCQPI